MKKFILIIAAAFFSVAVNAQNDHMHDHGGNAVAVNNEAFNSIKNLVGDWKGTSKWSISPKVSQMDAKYYLTGNGTAVIEDLISDGKTVMTSVYHLDGTDLRMTHYCGAGNQPRLKAEAFDNANKTVDFKFVDITNLTTPDAAHVSGLKIKFDDNNKLVLVFTFTRAGTDIFEEINLIRAA